MTKKQKNTKMRHMTKFYKDVKYVLCQKLNKN
jgi:homoserine trans-succinylase